MKYQEYRKKLINLRRLIIGASIASVPISLITLATVVTVSVLAGVKGNITEVSATEVSYVYGEGITMSGSAFMSDVTFEYSEHNQNTWTEQTPTYVGIYDVRARSNGSAGNKYSDIQTFEILPKEVNAKISSSTKTYGEKLDINIEGLVKGDSLNKDYIVDLSTTKSLEADASINKDSVHILNSKAEDVTACYKINFEDKHVTFAKRQIRLSFNQDVNETYTGDEFYNDEYTLSGSLAYDQNIRVLDGISVSEIGHYSNNHSIKVFDGEDDVSDCYNISITRENSIDINKITLRLSSNYLTKEYDGKPFSIDEASVNYDESKLLNGHHIEVTFDEGNFENYKVSDFSSTVYNTFDYEIKNELGEDVSEYYSTSVTHGTMKINKRNISVKGRDISYDYDHKEHEYTEFDITSGELAENDTIQVTDNYAFGPDVVSKTTNVLNYAIYKDIGGISEDVTDCYNINKVNGTIEINPIQLEVYFPANPTVTYDGYSHGIYDVNNVQVNGLPSDYFIDTRLPNSEDNMVIAANVKAYSLDKSKLYVEVFYNDVENSTIYNVTSNFRINYSFGSMLINKRDINITTQNYSKTYDGENISTSLGLFSWQADNLADFHTCQVTEMKNPDNYHVVEDASLKLSYTIVDANYQNVTSNYNVNIIDGTYSINKRNITVEAEPYYKEYDGTGDYNIILYDVDGALAPTDTFSFNPKRSINEYRPGTYNVDLDDTIFRIVRGEEDVTDQYNISFLSNATVNISQREVDIYQYRDYCYYDMQAHGINNPDDFGIWGTLEDDVLTIDSSFDLYQINDYRYDAVNFSFDNYFHPFVYNEVRGDVTDCYFFNYCDYQINGDERYYPFRILQKRIIATSSTIEKEFDNKLFNLDPGQISYYLEGGVSLDEGDIISFEVTTQGPLHVMDSLDPNLNVFSFDVVVKDKNNNDVTEKYAIDKIYGSLTINKRIVNVKTQEYVRKVYNGKTIGINSAKIDVTTSSAIYCDKTLPKNHHIYASLTGAMEAYMIGNYHMTFELSYVQIIDGVSYPADENDTEMIDNTETHSITYIITQRSLKITTKSARLTYYPDDPIVATEQRTVEGLASTDKIYFNGELYSKNKRDYNSIADKTLPGVYENEVGEISIIRTGNQGEQTDVTSCYDITTKIGTITIVEA